MSLTALLARVRYYSPLLLTPPPPPPPKLTDCNSRYNLKLFSKSCAIQTSPLNRKRKPPSTSPIQRCFGLKPNVYNSRVILSNTGYEERGCFSTGFVRGCSIGWTLINSNVSCILKGIQGNTFQPEYISTNTLFNLHLN